MRSGIRYLFTATIVSCGVLGFATQSGEAFSDQVIQQGATGDDVVELQARLQYIGYFDNTIDGVFGWGTYWGAREYQEEFGMEVDGLVGSEMKEKLEQTTEYDQEHVQDALENAREFTHYGDTPKEQQKGPKGSADEEGQERGQDGEEQQPAEPAPPEGEQPEADPEQAQEEAPQEGEQPDTGEEVPDDEQGNEPNVQKAMNTPDGYSDNDIQIMANAVHGEARGEPYEGKVAVAAVIINRTEDAEFPDTANEVIFEPRAFTAVADGQIYLEPDEESREAVLDAINGQDPSNGAIYYYNPVTATSEWIFSRDVHTEIGKHLFAD
ncbi:N-acetylmuramoyl-L-alanine amidase [Geomicrobium halophilum]|uniref:Spore cortex-lytic enzyme n=1 Tax=Geomicrobium halophilum TaxID=549000 RepID=A0A841PY41_9BACL|nr:spore cortex-lytic enzyme [Geomicrobium halophilum]MBB6449015.1 N-acetylmuramoyl-L-alanine amidase [Geomicrobium halophilum]